jgi:hypothetical protein
MMRSARLPINRSYNAEWPLAPMTSNSTLSSAESSTMSHRMSGQDVGMKFYVPFFCHCPGALQSDVEAARSCSCSLSNFFDEFGHIIDLFDRDHVELGGGICFAIASANVSA